MDKHDIGRHVRWETEVTEASWDDDERDVDRAAPATDDGTTTELSARAVITAVGQLDRPHTPDDRGAARLRRTGIPLRAWDHSVDLDGKRVAMIGAGASGFQIAPTIAAGCAAPHRVPAHGAVDVPQPELPRRSRSRRAVGVAASAVLRPVVPLPAVLAVAATRDSTRRASTRTIRTSRRAVSEINEVTRVMFTDWIISQVGDDPDLQAKVVPDYPATGKRTLQDNGSWLRTLTRDNVELVRTGIDHIEPDAVVTDDGIRHPADVIVYATGFRATKVLWPMTIRGRDGEVLSERWGERPSAYLGITIPDYPNFFCMYGPGTDLASGGSLIFHSECQMRYITQCLELLIAGGHATMEPTVEKTTDWHERSQAEMRTMVWSQPSIKHSFFKNAYGEVHTLSPWRLVDYWAWTRTPDPDDFVFG